MCPDTPLLPLSLATPGSHGHEVGSRQPVPSQLLLSLLALGTGHRAVVRQGGATGRGRGRTRLDLCHQASLSALRLSGADPSPASLNVTLRMGTREPVSQGSDCCEAGMLSMAASSKLRKLFCQSAGFGSRSPSTS